MDDSQLPSVVCVRLPGVFDAGAVDTEVFVVNGTGTTYWVSSESNSFTTVDEEVGTVVEHGSGPVRVRVSPGEAVRIADVRGWEWDGHVGTTVTFTDAASGSEAVRSYAFKNSQGRLAVPGDGREGWVVPPRRIGWFPPGS